MVGFSPCLSRLLMATPAGFEPATCRLEGGCSIQLSYGAERSPADRASYNASMRPGNDPVRREIVGIGQDLARDRLRLFDPVGDAVALGVGDRLLLGAETQLDLRAHVGRTRPAHQRLDLARL